MVEKIGLDDLMIRFEFCKSDLNLDLDPFARSRSGFSKMDLDQNLFSTKNDLNLLEQDHFFIPDLNCGSRSLFFGSPPASAL